MHDSELMVRRVLEAGARGFVSKSSAPECLIDAVHAVMAGRRYLSPGLPSQLLQQGVTPAQPLASLTQREFEIFRLLSRGDSPEDCARSLHLSRKTVSNHQSLIKEKLGLCTTAAMAHLALRHGLIQPEVC
ncbi:response regulator transcription factor [Variovorax sp. OV329]|uniref:LuxR C-terminal-related transcriptional regulator n=1 Tax=Variovorax sp. OV329 TaxID=1882825 RepID=UPI0008E44913|nr:response regulator transcription factor [Variovorax sp. OV329]SFM03930.1 regulatory protein, luxR family [Variovorax sp. OV329]